MDPAADARVPEEFEEMGPGGKDPPPTEITLEPVEEANGLELGNKTDRGPLETERNDGGLRPNPPADDEESDDKEELSPAERHRRIAVWAAAEAAAEVRAMPEYDPFSSDDEDTFPCHYLRQDPGAPDLPDIKVPGRLRRWRIPSDEELKNPLGPDPSVGKGWSPEEGDVVKREVTYSAQKAHKDKLVLGHWWTNKMYETLSPADRGKDLVSVYKRSEHQILQKYRQISDAKFKHSIGKKTLHKAKKTLARRVLDRQLLYGVSEEPRPRDFGLPALGTIPGTHNEIEHCLELLQRSPTTKVAAIKWARSLQVWYQRKERANRTVGDKLLAVTRFTPQAQIASPYYKKEWFGWIWQSDAETREEDSLWNSIRAMGAKERAHDSELPGRGDSLDRKEAENLEDDDSEWNWLKESALSIFDFVGKLRHAQGECTQLLPTPIWNEICRRNDAARQKYPTNDGSERELEISPDCPVRKLVQERYVQHLAYERLHVLVGRRPAPEGCDPRLRLDPDELDYRLISTCPSNPPDGTDNEFATLLNKANKLARRVYEDEDLAPPSRRKLPAKQDGPPKDAVKAQSRPNEPPQRKRNAQEANMNDDAGDLKAEADGSRRSPRKRTLTAKAAAANNPHYPSGRATRGQSKLVFEDDQENEIARL